MNGLLYIDKPEGWTSFDVVAKIRSVARRVLREKHESRGYCHAEHLTKAQQDHTHKANSAQPQRQSIPGELGSHRCRCKLKVGHTGTLDPAATGLLVICIGKYTKKVPQLIKQDKTYEVELTLGRVSTTADKEGKITQSTLGNAITEPKPSELDRALMKFVGKIKQTPPIFSAIKVGGKRAYELARKGEPVKIEPRAAYIYSITGTLYDYPLVTFTARVGSGTYIRSLAVDIGEELQTGAYMSELRRISIGDISVDQAVAISDITEDYLITHCDV